MTVSVATNFEKITLWYKNVILIHITLKVLKEKANFLGMKYLYI